MPPPSGGAGFSKMVVPVYQTTSCYTEEVHIVKLIAMIISDLTCYCIFYIHGILWLGWRGFFSGRVYSQNMGRLYLESPFPMLFCRNMTTMSSIKQNIGTVDSELPNTTDCVKILDCWKYKATYGKM